ncbi:GMC family oxidoreductase [Paenibacillus sp. y28]|uniref:GMC family oxidoreductase n=1 Tax=Paenibacillus sp. y28 TaxID=3129110 RepID=UPI0030172ADF
MRIRITEERMPKRPHTCIPPMLPPLEQWIPLASLEQMQQTEYDALIVGSGAGGGAVLWRLCERWQHSGKRIGMLEAGDLLIPTNARNISTLDQERCDQFISNPKVSIPMRFPQFPNAIEVIALGGGTLVWDANCPRFLPSVMEHWPLPPQELEPFYNIAEQVMNVTKAYSEQAPVTQILLNRLWLNGYPEASAMPRALNLNPVKRGKIESDVFFSSILFLARALNLRKFDLAANARVTRVLTERGKAVGVEVKDREKTTFRIKAKTIILSASTFETPRILLYSGIVGHAVGHYLLDQIALRGTIRVNRSSLFPRNMGPLWILIPQTDQRPFQFMISEEEAKSSENEIAVLIRSYAAIEPRFENRVELDPQQRDDFGVPKLKVHFSLSPHDEAQLSRLTLATKQVIRTLGAIHEEICLRPPGDPHHESGTCRMGVDPAVSATNPYGQIHGIPSLFVADNSVLPSLGAANPTLTTVALSIRTADYIASQAR